jgi:IclR family pca regulon transcriptional regulator
VTEATAGHSQSLERGLAILASFGPRRPLLGISELARGVELSRSTAHRYVATLTTLGYLEQDEPTRKYRLGPRSLDLGFAAINSLELREVATPYLRRLAEETGFTANLAIRDGVHIVYIQRVRSAVPPPELDIELDLHVGSRLPAYCTSMGKVLLAFLPERERDALIDRISFRPRGPNSLPSQQALLLELERVRNQGIAVNNEELAYGLRSFAAPVRAANGEVVAAANLAVHTSSVPIGELLVQVGPALRRAADGISARLGFGGVT